MSKVENKVTNDFCNFQEDTKLSDVFKRGLVDNDFDLIYIENTIRVVASMINDNDFEYDNNKFDFEKCTFYDFNSL